MSSKIKNIILFLGIFIAAILVYIFVFKKDTTPSLVITGGDTNQVSVGENTPVEVDDFLAVLLNLQNIKLDDSIFINTAFTTLEDFTVNLIPEGNEGRSNPFAPIGSDVVVSGASQSQANDDLFLDLFNSEENQ